MFFLNSFRIHSILVFLFDLGCLRNETNLFVLHEEITLEHETRKCK